MKRTVLDRLHGPLRDAITGQAGGSTQLEALERGSFFVVPLDDAVSGAGVRRWYRYHHLFADVLQTFLKAEQPDQVAALHKRASVWSERNGAMPAAVWHALAAGDFARAADMIERAFSEMGRSRQEATLLGWFKALPEALVRDRPILCNLYAGVLMQTGHMEGVDAWRQSNEPKICT